MYRRRLTHASNNVFSTRKSYVFDVVFVSMRKEYSSYNVFEIFRNIATFDIIHATAVYNAVGVVGRTSVAHPRLVINGNTNLESHRALFNLNAFCS